MLTFEFTYVVQSCDTLFLIAKKFNTSVEIIMTRNNIINPSLIHPEQTLIIPVKGIYYTVKHSDTIYLIAEKFGVPYESIIYVNNLVFPYTIYPGQMLFIPGAVEVAPPVPPICPVPPAPPVPPIPPVPPSTTCPFYYVVRPGDTLWDIANRYGVSLDALIKANYIVNPNLIYPGQTIIIPCPSAPPVEYPTLKLGDTGPFVVNLQSRLKSLGFYKGTVDGIFGTKTEEAVKEYQKSRGLTATGIVDSNTWNALLFNTPPITIDINTDDTKCNETIDITDKKDDISIEDNNEEKNNQG
ncbi:MAG: LysM peptidoglycan-binding domain-containing protein [Thermoanaerobacteraceae bacterium]|nr:LysM peptidoglycan-binding domain-containing protein [Thermoanaerobacteraceae bacterium]